MEEKMKLRYIDTLRGLAILAVIVVHCSMYGNNDYLPAIVQSVALYGIHGVQLFYIVSAFTLFLTLQNREEREDNLWPKFFIRRFFRIAPMYYIGIVYYLWQDGMGARYALGDADHITTSNILANFLFIHGFNPYWINSLVPGGWSIAVEMVFYCMVPLLFVALRNARQAFVFVLAALAVRLALQVFLLEFQPINHERLWLEFLYMYLPNQLPVFGLGILFYFIVKDNYKLSISPALILVAAVVLTVQFVGAPIGYPVLPTHFLFGCAFLVLCIALSKYEFKLLVNPVFTYIGKISYSMYLVHFAVLYWLVEFNMADYFTGTSQYIAVLNFIVRLLVATALTTLISTFFYKVVELPMQVLGKRLLNKWFQVVPNSKFQISNSKF